MKSLITVADLITPNYTEAALLSDTEVDFSATPTTKSVLEMCKTLSADGPQRIVITSVPSRDSIKNISYDATTATFDEAVTYKVDFSTCGTGDIFTSALTGLLLKKDDLHAATAAATRFLTKAIEFTAASGADPREGVQVEPCLADLIAENRP